MTTITDLPTAKTRPASNWSAIWVLPLIALIIGGWLGWRAYNETGIEINVRFESGEGLQVNKTEVVYKGMAVGNEFGRASSRERVCQYVWIAVVAVCVNRKTLLH